MTEPTSTRDFVRTTVGGARSRLSDHLSSVREGNDAEAVHRARVATRRLRSDLRTYVPLIDAVAVDELRGELAWLGGLLGNVRDPQVLAGRLAEDMADLVPAVRPDELARLTSLLGERARFHHAQLLDALGGDRFRELQAALDQVADDPPVTSKVSNRAAGPVARRLALRQWRRARRFALSLDDSPTDAELHDVRKRLKRARYAAQSVKQLGLGSKSFRRELADLQDLLGDHHDVAVLRALLAAEVDRLDHRAAFAAGRIAGRAEARSSELRSAWPSVRDRIGRLEFD